MTTATMRKMKTATAKKSSRRRVAGVRSESGMDLVRVILAIIFPPIGVYLQVGLSGQFWLNILLTLLGYIPGIIHAVWIIATHSENGGRTAMSH